MERMLLRRNTLITIFVAGWLLLFQYETLRASYLSPLAGHRLPKCPLLFPPAGWIMFFNVDQSFGFAEVYGVRARVPTLLDPHAVFATKAVGYDNIHRNVLISVLSRDRVRDFCRYLRRKFPDDDAFAVVYAEYPNLVTTPDRILRQVAYGCP